MYLEELVWDYKNILIAPMAYGQSLTILALVEALQNDKKSI